MALLEPPPSLTPSQQMLKCLANQGKSPGLQAWGSAASTLGSSYLLLVNEKTINEMLKYWLPALLQIIALTLLESRFLLSLTLMVKNPPKLNLWISNLLFCPCCTVPDHSLCSFSPLPYRYHWPELHYSADPPLHLEPSLGMM